MLGRLRALIIKELLAILRDPKGRMVLIGPPIMQLLIFSYAATLEVSNVDIAFLNHDGGRWGTELSQRIAASRTFREVTPITGLGQAREALDRRQVLAAVSGLADGAAGTRPETDRWSVLETLEHLVFVEHRFLGLAQRGDAYETARVDPERERSLSAGMRDRRTRRQAPEAALPVGRFRSLADAITAFNEQYLLEAFLSFNDAFAVRLASHWLGTPESGESHRHWPTSVWNREQQRPSSFWMCRCR